MFWWYVYLFILEIERKLLKELKIFELTINADINVFCRALNVALFSFYRTESEIAINAFIFTICNSILHQCIIWAIIDKCVRKSAELSERSQIRWQIWVFQVYKYRFLDKTYYYIIKKQLIQYFTKGLSFLLLYFCSHRTTNYTLGIGVNKISFVVVDISHTEPWVINTYTLIINRLPIAHNMPQFRASLPHHVCSFTQVWKFNYTLKIL
jgi:hypothetical protein